MDNPNDAGKAAIVSVKVEADIIPRVRPLEIYEEMAEFTNKDWDKLSQIPPRRKRFPIPKDWSPNWWMPETEAECPRCFHVVKRREIHVCVFSRQPDVKDIAHTLKTGG